MRGKLPPSISGQRMEYLVNAARETGFYLDKNKVICMRVFSYLWLIKT